MLVKNLFKYYLRKQRKLAACNLQWIAEGMFALIENFCKQAWEYYCQATELGGKLKIVKVGALCSVMGQGYKNHDALSYIEQREQLLLAINNRKKLRFRFNRACQTESETVNWYMVRQRQLSESCEFEALWEGLIGNTVKPRDVNTPKVWTPPIVNTFPRSHFFSNTF